MTINTSLFTAQSGDYSVIAESITVNDALTFDDIYQALISHASVSRKLDSEDFYTITDYVQSQVMVNLSEASFDIASIATLKAVGVIRTDDNIHIGLTLLGVGFYQFIQN